MEFGQHSRLMFLLLWSMLWDTWWPEAVGVSAGLKTELCSVVVPWWLSDVYYLFSTHSALGLRTDWILWNLIGASEVKSVVWKHSMKLVKCADGPALLLSPVEERRKVKKRFTRRSAEGKGWKFRVLPLDCHSLEERWMFFSGLFQALEACHGTVH